MSFKISELLIVNKLSFMLQKNIYARNYGIQYASKSEKESCNSTTKISR